MKIKNEKTKLIIWAVVALVIGVIIGMIITNVTTGNANKINQENIYNNPATPIGTVYPAIPQIDNENSENYIKMPYVLPNACECIIFNGSSYDWWPNLCGGNQNNCTGTCSAQYYFHGNLINRTGNCTPGRIIGDTFNYTVYTKN